MDCWIGAAAGGEILMTDWDLMIGLGYDWFWTNDWFGVKRKGSGCGDGRSPWGLGVKMFCPRGGGCPPKGAGLLFHYQTADGTGAVAGEDDVVDAGCQALGADAEADGTGGLQLGGVDGAAHVVDYGYVVVAAVGEVNVDAGLGGGGVGEELAEGLLAFGREDGE